ncbi:TPA: pilS cassette protein [Neisseria gonorrhoeae]|nr:pilS cassette protein [Neisseria gonorrhoeae]ROU26443.1 pilS cassette protein [Neisseria gonorrhoeae]ROU54410.1 pilS cassette protein [Neisseria gonorrhoeae]ROU70928.1 pilS cassette protein [Neisseria gonorrhoeae]ROU75329.1 pilS cassette protein [Neisseria gonorrhoeae]
MPSENGRPPPSFPRKWESRTQNLKKPFCPISSCTDRSRFPPARE